MRWNGFGRSLAFAAAVAVAWPLIALVVAPVLGARFSLSLYVVVAAALCAWGIAPDRARGAGAAVAVAALGGLALLVGRDVAEVAAGAAIALGVARSGLLYRARPARAVILEVTLLGGGLALAHWLATPGLLGVALALWGFFAVQAVFFAIGGVRARRGDAGDLDGFEQARRRALALLEG